jgi:hypothetical protein
MQVPKSSMASSVLLDLGRYHLAALSQREEAKPLIATFQAAHDALAAAKTARHQAEEAIVGPRVVARFAEADLERVIRQVALAAHVADNNADSGPAYKAVFPKGLDAELRPRGAAQVTASRALRSRLDSQPAAAPVKASTLADLDRTIAALAQALEARATAERTLSLARATEDGARERFVSAYDSNAGAIRQMFPRSRATQDLHFDEFRARPAADDDEEQPTQPTGPVTPA